MRALTVCDPWATALIFGPKRIENRPVRFNHRGRLCICVGKSRSWFTETTCALLAQWWPGDDGDSVWLRGPVSGARLSVDEAYQQALECLGDFVRNEEERSAQ